MTTAMLALAAADEWGGDRDDSFGRYCFVCVLSSSPKALFTCTVGSTAITVESGLCLSLQPVNTTGQLSLRIDPLPNGGLLLVESRANLSQRPPDLSVQRIDRLRRIVVVSVLLAAVCSFCQIKR
eukprot:GHVU01143517.1.p1 GENE.GHVU01143517.1~~GHVU01143517.1.p1  ORF type:complete len:125 (+),score=13.61 GHVU01143517.1:228-602(+)